VPPGKLAPGQAGRRLKAIKAAFIDSQYHLL
jgi:hypothetical protein